MVYKKEDMEKRVGELTGLTRNQIDSVFEAIVNSVRHGLQNHDEVYLFGLLRVTKFLAKEVPAREYHHPGNPEIIIKVPAKPACTKLKVKALKPLKDMI